MSEIKFNEIPVKDREQRLRDTCIKRDFIDVKRMYTAAEIEEFEHYVSQSLIEVKNIEAEIQEKMAEHIEPLKKRVKQYQTEADENLQKVMKRYEIENLELFGYPDYEKGTMNYYNDIGELKHVRALLPGEYQTKIVTLNRAVGDGTDPE